jgi:hypothetical protein
MRRLLPLLLVLTACDADAHAKHGHHPTPYPVRTPITWAPTPTPIAQPTGLAGNGMTADFYVRDGQEIWIRPAGAPAKKMLRTDRHEGLGELHVSPDKHWIWTLVTYPYDVVNPKDGLVTYPILVYVDTAIRIDREEFPARFGLNGVPKAFDWIGGKLATLKVTMQDGSAMEVEMPPAGPQNLPPAQRP